MINEPVPVLSQTRRSPADHANPRGRLAYSGSNPGPATTSQNNPWPARTRSGGCPVYAVCVVSAGPSGCLGPGVGVVPGLFSRVVVTCRLAEPARACCRGEDGSGCGAMVCEGGAWHGRPLARRVRCCCRRADRPPVGTAYTTRGAGIVPGVACVPRATSSSSSAAA